MAVSVLDHERFVSPGIDSKLPIYNEDIVASAVAHPAPLALISQVSGTAEIITIGLPWPDFAGTVIFIPTVQWTCTAAGTSTATKSKIAVIVGAVTVGKPYFFTHDPYAKAWYPSHVA